MEPDDPSAVLQVGDDQLLHLVAVLVEQLELHLFPAARAAQVAQQGLGILGQGRLFALRLAAEGRPFRLEQPPGDLVAQVGQADLERSWQLCAEAHVPVDKSLWQVFGRLPGVRLGAVALPSHQILDPPTFHAPSQDLLDVVKVLEHQPLLWHLGGAVVISTQKHN